MADGELERAVVLTMKLIIFLVSMILAGAAGWLQSDVTPRNMPWVKRYLLILLAQLSMAVMKMEL